MNTIWPEDDLWYSYTHHKVLEYLQSEEIALKIEAKTKILNAGSAGNDYGIIGNHLHLDIAESHLKNIPNALVGNIEKIPLNENTFDLCICVGSVIKYCDALSSISEFARVLKHGGYLILDYDQSKSFEFIGTQTYNKNAEIITTFNSGYNDKIWVYSDEYISDILKEVGFKILRKKYYHNLSPLAIKFTKMKTRPLNLQSWIIWFVFYHT